MQIPLFTALCSCKALIMKSERIVQITDPHVVENYQDSGLYWDPVKALHSVVDNINSLTDKPRYVIATVI